MHFLVEQINENLERKNETILFKEKQTKIILLLKNNSQNWYISMLAKASNTTYVHTCNFLLNCELAGIIKTQKNGKMKCIKLTDKGQEIVNKISEIYSLINKKQELNQVELNIEDKDQK